MCFEQLRALLKLRDFCNNLALVDDKFAYNEQFWEELEKIVSVLELPANVMTKIQREDLCLSDLHGLWIELTQNLKTMSHDLANELKMHLELRESNIFGNIPVISSTYLDPRFQCLLYKDPAAMNLARKELVLLFKKLQDISQERNGDDSNETEMSRNSTNDGDGETDLLETFLQEACTVTSVEEGPIELFVRDFWNVQRLKATENVMHFWNNNRATRPDLYRLAEIVFAAAPTVVAVERTFSTLDFILTKLRNSLSDHSVERILLIKLNKELFEKDSISLLYIHMIVQFTVA